MFEMGSSSRGTYVSAPHMQHVPSDIDIGPRLAPGNISWENLLTTLLEEVQRFLLPALAKGYIILDECWNGHRLAKTVSANTKRCDRCGAEVSKGETYCCDTCDYDVCLACMNAPEENADSLEWNCEAGRFGIKVSRSLSRSISCSVDLVPFQRVEEGKDFPQLVLFDRLTEELVPNNPPLFTYQFNLEAAKFPFLVLVAAVIKYWNFIQSPDGSGKAPLKGMHVESLLLDVAWSSENNFAMALMLGFEHCAKHVLDPDVQPPGGSVHVGPSYIEDRRRQYVQRLLRSAASLAKFAVSCDEAGDHELAVGAWSHLLCETCWQDDGHAMLLRNPFLDWSVFD